ncbi:hypothetical protein NMG60_11017591 [Bertholletia excelsa]
MHFINRIPAPLQVHCKSKDSDIGTHIQKNGQDLPWHFRRNLFDRTLFFCTCQWGARNKRFAVWDKRLEHYCKDAVGTDYTCFWEARTDGFYISNDKVHWTKINSW